jgi:hypothetical protein
MHSLDYIEFDIPSYYEYTSKFNQAFNDYHKLHPKCTLETFVEIEIEKFAEYEQIDESIVDYAIAGLDLISLDDDKLVDMQAIIKFLETKLFFNIEKEGKRLKSYSSITNTRRWKTITKEKKLDFILANRDYFQADSISNWNNLENLLLSQKEESWNMEKYHEKSTTMHTIVLAIHYLLKEIKPDLSDIDKTQIAEFIRFLTQKEKGKKIGNTNIYSQVKNLDTKNDATHRKRLNEILVHFSNLKLENIISKINKELEESK